MARSSVTSILAVLALASGCASHEPETVLLPSGERALLTDCNGTSNSWADCYKQAEAMCRPNRYLELNREEQFNGGVSGGLPAMVGSSVVSRILYYRCEQQPH